LKDRSTPIPQASACDGRLSPERAARALLAASVARTYAAARRYSPGGVVILGSQWAKSPRQYRCAWGTWKISSMYGSGTSPLKVVRRKAATASQEAASTWGCSSCCHSDGMDTASFSLPPDRDSCRNSNADEGDTVVTKSLITKCKVAQFSAPVEPFIFKDEGCERLPSAEVCTYSTDSR